MCSAQLNRQSNVLSRDERILLRIVGKDAICLKIGDRPLSLLEGAADTIVECCRVLTVCTSVTDNIEVEDGELKYMFIPDRHSC